MMSPPLDNNRGIEENIILQKKKMQHCSGFKNLRRLCWLGTLFNARLIQLAIMAFFWII